jgi:hypothetical protein
MSWRGSVALAVLGIGLLLAGGVFVVTNAIAAAFWAFVAGLWLLVRGAGDVIRKRGTGAGDAWTTSLRFEALAVGIGCAALALYGVALLLGLHSPANRIIFGALCLVGGLVGISGMFALLRDVGHGRDVRKRR